MIALAIVIAVILLLALLRLALYVEYSESGVSLLLMVGPVPLRILPKKEKSEKQELKKLQKKQLKKEKKAKKKAEKSKTEKPGGLKGFLDKLPLILKGLGRLRRKLLVKKLTVRFVSANADPSKAALMYGASAAAFGATIPLLENSLRIRRRDIRSSADFEATQPSIYVKAAISLAIWEAVYVFVAILPLFTKVKTVGKEDNSDGQTTDKRTLGDNDAESQGDDRR